MDKVDRSSLSTQHVFNIPELLETILIHLPPRELLISQRTSRGFRNTVQGSIRLRRILFLEPEWASQTCASKPHSINEWNNNIGMSQQIRPQNNRLLLCAFPGCYPTVTLVTVPEDQRHLRGERDGTLMQQMAFAQGAWGTGSSGSEAKTEEWSWDVCISFPARREKQEMLCEKAKMHSDASWRRMLLSRPACKELYLVRRWQRSRLPAMVREAGITMGDLYDEVTKPVPGCEDREWHQSYISSDQDWHFEGNIRCVTVVR